MFTSQHWLRLERGPRQQLSKRKLLVCSVRPSTQPTKRPSFFFSGFFSQAAAAAEEKLDLADATAAAEAKAFAEAQAAKREVEAAVAAKAKKAIAKREAEAAVLSQMNEVPLMAASCCTEACVAVMVRFQWAAEWGGQEVFLAGTFSDWEELPVERSPSGDFVLALTLEPGHYSYKYKVDGKWCTSHMEPQVRVIRVGK